MVVWHHKNYYEEFYLYRLRVQLNILQYFHVLFHRQSVTVSNNIYLLYFYLHHVQLNILQYFHDRYHMLQLTVFD